MTSKIQSKILLFFGVIIVMVVCSGTCFSQTCQNKFPSGSSYKPEDGWEIKQVDKVGDQLVVLVCRDGAPKASPTSQPTKTATCPNPSAQQPTVTAAEAADNARREKEEERAKRKQAEEERRKSINEWKLNTGVGSRGVY